MSIKPIKTRQLILSSAENVFASKGFESATIDEIVEVAHIAKGTFYYHFKSKDELFFEIIDHGIDELAVAIQSQLVMLPKPADSLFVLIQIQFDFFQKRKAFCKVFFAQFWHLQSRWKRDIEKLKFKYHSVLMELLKDQLPESGIPKEVAANYIFWLVSMTSLNYAVYGSDFTQEKLIIYAQQFIRDGLKLNK